MHAYIHIHNAYHNISYHIISYHILSYLCFLFESFFEFFSPRLTSCSLITQRNVTLLLSFFLFCALLLSLTGLESADLFQNVRTLTEAKYLLNILLNTATTTVNTTSFSKSKEKDVYTGVEKENLCQTQIMHLSNNNKTNTLTTGDMKNEEKGKEKDNVREKQKEKEKVRITSRGIVLSALKGHDNLFSSPPTPSPSLSSFSSSSSSSSSLSSSSSAPAPPSLSFSLSVPVQMTAKDTIMQQRLNAFNKSMMMPHKNIDEHSVKTNNSTSSVKMILKSKSSSSSTSSLSLMKSKNIPTPIKMISEKKNVFQIKNVTPKKNIKIKNSLRNLNSATNSIENHSFNGKVQARVSGSNNTDINRKTTVAHVAASLAKMKENMSQCMPVNLTVTSQHNTPTITSTIERNKKVGKNVSSFPNKKDNHIEIKKTNNTQVRKIQNSKVKIFDFF